MYKLFILTAIFLLATINLYSQRNDGNRGGNVDSGRNPGVEREPERTTPITYPKNPVRERQKDNQTIVYPKNPINPVPKGKSIPIEGDCIVKPMVSYPIQYTLPPPSSMEMAMKSFKLGDYYEASLKFTEWLVNNPDDVDAIFYRGICYYEMEWYGYAIEDFNIVIRLDPEYAEAYYYRGLSRFFRQERDFAEIDLEIAYELGIKIAGIMLKKYFW
jgi:tetratricopeptide (TPR) repeat protein